MAAPAKTPVNTTRHQSVKLLLSTTHFANFCKPDFSLPGSLFAPFVASCVSHFLFISSCLSSIACSARCWARCCLRLRLPLLIPALEYQECGRHNVTPGQQCSCSFRAARSIPLFGKVAHYAKFRGWFAGGSR